MFAIVFGVLQIFYTYKRIYLIVGLYVQHILYRPALAYLASFGYIVDSHPIAFAFLGEKQHIVVHRGGINIFDEVFVFCSASLGAYATSILSLKLGKRSTFDISLMRNGDNHLVVGIEIFGVHLFARIYYLGTTRVAEFVFKLQHFVDNDLHSSFDFCQNIAQIFYTFQKLFVLQTQLILLHSSELAKSKFYDISSLPLGKREALHKAFLRLRRCFRIAYYTYGFVEIIEDNHQTFEQFGSLECLFQIVFGTTHYHLVPVFDKVTYKVDNIKQLRTSLYKSHVIYGKRTL